MFDRNGALALLFARHLATQDCTCGQAGYCPAHGEYTPATDDPEVLEAVREASRRHGGGVHIIRKRLPN